MALPRSIFAGLACYALLFLKTGRTMAATHHGPVDTHQIDYVGKTPVEQLGDLVVAYGYPLEQHQVETRDGYLLGLFRIPFGADGPGGSSASGGGSGASGNDAQQRRPPVLLQHGLLDSCAGFLLNGPGRSLAFLLADAGYDVWLGNMRGSTLSRGHAWLDTTGEEYWMFSYDEMAYHDLPSMVAYVLNATGAHTLRYVGHSQGTTVLLAALSLHPWLNQAISSAALLAPVAVAKHLSSVPLLAMAALGVDNVFALLGVHEFLPSQRVVAELEGQMCRLRPFLCANILAAIAGYNPDNLDNSKLPMYLSYTPAGTSVQNMVHWAQAVRSRAPNTMSFFDFGTDCSDGVRCNQIQYGQDAAPLYNLSAVAVPLAIYSGGADRLSVPLDVEYLLESLQAGVARHVRILPSYEHLDFIWGIDAREVVYQDVMAFLAASDWGAARGHPQAAGRAQARRLAAWRGARRSSGR